MTTCRSAGLAQLASKSPRLAAGLLVGLKSYCFGCFVGVATEVSFGEGQNHSKSWFSAEMLILIESVAIAVRFTNKKLGV